MIISRRRRFIFVHIPKTGGTSLALALEARAAKDDILIGDTPKARARRGRVRGLKAAGRLWKHSTLADIAGLVTDDEVAAFFTLTLVRNPWERLASYWHWLRAQHFAHPAVGLAKAHDFSGFLNHPHTRLSIAAHPYGSYLRDRNGVERGHFARIEAPEDLAAFEAHLGFHLTPLPQANASDRPADWRRFYSDADAALVADICAEDIARFGYRFGGAR
jgi:hypothetical protein